MPISDLVALTINLQEPAVLAPGFGITLMVADFAPAVVTAFGVDLIKSLTKGTWKTVLAGLGLTSSDSEYLMVEDHFSQARSPAQALLARRATPVAQVDNVSVDTAEAGTYTITINGQDAVFVAAAETATQIRDALIPLVTALGERVTAAVGGGSDDLDVTADEAGEPFTIAVTHSVTPADISTSSTTPNTGISADIVAWKAERNDWYFLCLHEKTEGQIRAIAAATETEVKMAFCASADANVQGMALGDLFSDLAALGYVRTVVMWHDNDAQHPHAAVLGKMSSSIPGDESWAKQTLVSVAGFVPTDSTRLRSKHAFYLEAFAAVDGSTALTMTTNAQVISGQWIDLVWGRDYLFSLIEASVLTAMRDAPKIPYTTAGGAILDNAIRGPLLQVSDAEDAGLVVADSIVVTIPTPEDQSGASKTARDLPGVTFAATLQGDVETLDITGDLLV